MDYRKRSRLQKVARANTNRQKALAAAAAETTKDIDLQEPTYGKDQGHE